MQRTKKTGLKINGQKKTILRCLSRMLFMRQTASRQLCKGREQEFPKYGSGVCKLPLVWWLWVSFFFQGNKDAWIKTLFNSKAEIWISQKVWEPLVWSCYIVLIIMANDKIYQPQNKFLTVFYVHAICHFTDTLIFHTSTQTFETKAIYKSQYKLN